MKTDRLPAAPHPVAPQRVRAVLRKAGFPETRWRTTDRRDLSGMFSRGFAIDDDLGRNGGRLRVVVEHGESEMPDDEITVTLGRYAAALAAAGIACEVREGAVWVNVATVGNPEGKDR